MVMEFLEGRDLGQVLDRRRELPPPVVLELVHQGKLLPSSVGVGQGALFNSPKGITVDPKGVFYITDESNHRIRKMVYSSGYYQVSTIAGSGTGGYKDGTALSAQFKKPSRSILDKTAT